jgi:hypothetical protein
MELVKRVQKGQTTDRFNKVRSRFAGSANRSLSLIIGDDGQSLDLIAPSTEEFKMWYRGLNQIIKNNAAKREKTLLDVLYLRSRWEIADTKGTGNLLMSDIVAMLEGINANIEKSKVEAMFRLSDVDNSGQLSFDEFRIFFANLKKRPELEYLWSLLVTKRLQDPMIVGLARFSAISDSLSLKTMSGAAFDTVPQAHLQIVATIPDFLEFWKLIQGAEMTESELTSWMLRVVPGCDISVISYLAFQGLMTDRENQCFNPAYLSVYQDMTKPLSYYYIASSHNTYLTGDQLTGIASVDQYINVLSKGCRCVELDCWDGRNEPVILHGGTLVNPIPFKEVIIAIKDSAFRTDPYPVTLSIENHCSLPMQQMMAAIMIEAFGDMLYTVDECEVLPSPKELMYKILVKGKKLKKEKVDTTQLLLTLHQHGGGAIIVDDDDGDDEDEDTLSPSSQAIVPSQVDEATALDVFRGEETKSENRKSVTIRGGKITKKKKQEKVCQELSDITFLSAAKMKNFYAPDAQYVEKSANCICSYGEYKTSSILKSALVPWTVHNRRHIRYSWIAIISIENNFLYSIIYLVEYTLVELALTPLMLILF